jgi:hypothetical protein
MCSNCFSCHRRMEDDRFNQFIGKRDFITFHQERLRRLEEERNNCSSHRHSSNGCNCNIVGQASAETLNFQDFIRLQEDRLRGIRFENRLCRCGSCGFDVNHIYNGHQTGIVDFCTPRLI